MREQADKGKLSQIVNKLAEEYPKVEVAATLDRIKDAGFYWATRSGVTVALSDILTPPNKAEIVGAPREAGREGAGASSRRVSRPTPSVARSSSRSGPRRPTRSQAAMRDNFPEDNTINRMVSSGARGNWLQIRNIAGMRGLVNNPKGEIIPRPIISSYREGLSVAEYFIATHGARKGLADTALRTADSGYLTRRLVDVSQDVIIREDDCGTTKGLELPIAADGAGRRARQGRERRELGVLAHARLRGGRRQGQRRWPQAGDDVGDVLIDKLIEAGVETIKVRSVLTCDSAVGVCAQCYGRSLATGKLVDIGEAVGIIAAQSIGEPGTQLDDAHLPHRWFGLGRRHHAGSAPRAGALRGPHPQGCVADRRVRRSHHDRGDRPRQEGHPDARQRRRAARLPGAASARRSWSRTASTSRSASRSWWARSTPRRSCASWAPARCRRYLVNGVQGVYRSQGVPIHDKHIEVIVRQMLRKVTVVDHGDTTLLPGELVDFKKYQDDEPRGAWQRASAPRRVARSSWVSRRRRSRPSRGCRPRRSRRRPAC